MIKFAVWLLDYLGNPEDGYDFNDRSRCGVYEGRVFPSSRTFVKILKNNGFLRKSARLNKHYTIESEDGYMQICTMAGKPVYAIEEN